MVIDFGNIFLCLTKAPLHAGYGRCSSIFPNPDRSRLHAFYVKLPVSLTGGEDDRGPAITTRDLLKEVHSIP